MDTIFDLLWGIAAAIGKAYKRNAERIAREQARLQALPAARGGAARAAAPGPPPALAAERPRRATQPAARVTDPPDFPAIPERRLIEGLFTEPRTVAAAVVAAEILGPPIALRGWR